MWFSYSLIQVPTNILQEVINFITVEPIETNILKLMHAWFIRRNGENEEIECELMSSKFDRN